MSTSGKTVAPRATESETSAGSPSAEFPVGRRNRFYSAYLPAILYALLIFGLSSIPNLQAPNLGIGPVDKLVHAVEYAIFGVLLSRAVTGFPRLRNHILWRPLVIAVGGLYAASDELHQLLVPGRSAELADWVADVAGLVIGLFILLPLVHRLLKKKVKT